MDLKIVRDMIGFIRTEQQRRSDRLKNEDPDIAYDQWLFTDEPFINDMCLMVLVALRHQVERELVFIAARTDVGSAITRRQYEENVSSQREKLRHGDGWEKLEKKLALGSFRAWKTSMRTLQHLSNCHKHEPTQKPSKQILKHLNLPSKPAGRLITTYMPLPESEAFREGLAVSVSLSKGADYCEIADTFVDLAQQFLNDVRERTPLAAVTGGASLVEFGA